MSRSPRPSILALLALIFVTGFVSASAQQKVDIRNSSGEKRKICVYKASDKLNVIAERCFELNVGESVLWNRGYNPANFRVIVFKPQLIDDYLYTRDLPADTTVIIMGEGKRFGFGRDDPKPKAVKHRLKVCNQRFDEDIYFALGFDTPEALVTEGWWNVKRGKCVEIDVSERLFRGWRVPYNSLPRTYYYARTYGSRPLYWSGGDESRDLCINTGDAFTKEQLRPTGGKQRVGCDGPGEQFVSFRRLGDPKTNEEYYYLTF